MVHFFDLDRGACKGSCYCWIFVYLFTIGLFGKIIVYIEVLFSSCAIVRVCCM